MISYLIRISHEKQVIISYSYQLKGVHVDCGRNLFGLQHMCSVPQSEEPKTIRATERVKQSLTTLETWESPRPHFKQEKMTARQIKNAMTEITAFLKLLFDIPQFKMLDGKNKYINSRLIDKDNSFQCQAIFKEVSIHIGGPRPINGICPDIFFLI